MEKNERVHKLYISFFMAEISWELTLSKCKTESTLVTKKITHFGNIAMQYKYVKYSEKAHVWQYGHVERMQNFHINNLGMMTQLKDRADLSELFATTATQSHSKSNKNETVTQNLLYFMIRRRSEQRTSKSGSDVHFLGNAVKVSTEMVHSIVDSANI